MYVTCCRVNPFYLVDGTVTSATRANHCAIRAIANKMRRSLVRAFTTAQKEDDSYLAMWAWMSGDFSFLPAYWHIYDVPVARYALA